MRARGLTLLELLIALAMLALVASMAVPSFGNMGDRARLKSAAETMAADLSEARFLAAERGQTLHLVPRTGPGSSWCWAVATAPACACGAPQPCQLKTVQAREHAGIHLVEAPAVHVAPTGTVHVEAPDAGQAAALFETRHGERLRVDVSTLGRTSVCAPAAAVPGYRAC